MSAFDAYARYYDLLYRDKDYAGEARLVDQWLRALGAMPGRMLDVGCGTGAHARAFAALGWQVSGVDLAPEMIAIARARTPYAVAIEYAVGTAAEFRLDRQFAAVVSLFHVVSYQVGPEEAFAMFENVRRHLRPGGLFVFDFWHTAGVLADPPTVRVRRVEDERICVTRIAEPAHQPESCRIDVAYDILIENRSSHQVERIHELHRVRHFSLPELQFMLGRAGLTVERTLAGVSEAPLDGRSWYGLIIARAN